VQGSPRVVINFAIIVWDPPRVDPCTDTVYYPQ